MRLRSVGTKGGAVAVGAFYEPGPPPLALNSPVPGWILGVDEPDLGLEIFNEAQREYRKKKAIREITEHLKKMR